MGKKSPSPPPPPDYTGAAIAQGAANKDAAQASAFLSNPNVTSPYGTRSVSYSAGPGKDNYVPNITETFSPGQQAVFDQEQALSQKLGSLGNSAADYASGTLSKPLDFAGVPAAGQFSAATGVPALPSAYTGPGDLPGMPGNYDTVRNQVIDAMMSRVNTDMAQKRNLTNSDLVARGIMPQNDAYGREMDTIGRQENDARQQAIIAGGDAAAQAFGVDMNRRQQGYNEATTDAGLKYGQQLGLNQTGYTQATDQEKTKFAQQQEARQQAITEALAKRQVPLNEISAFRTGSQVQPLQFQNYTGADVPPPPLFGAAQAQYGADADRYNQQMDSRNNMTSGLFQLGSAGLLAY